MGDQSSNPFKGNVKRRCKRLLLGKSVGYKANFWDDIFDETASTIYVINAYQITLVDDSSFLLRLDQFQVCLTSKQLKRILWKGFIFPF